MTGELNDEIAEPSGITLELDKIQIGDQSASTTVLSNANNTGGTYNGSKPPVRSKVGRRREKDLYKVTTSCVKCDRVLQVVVYSDQEGIQGLQKLFVEGLTFLCYVCGKP